MSACVFAAATVAIAGRTTVVAAPPTDSAHAAHVASGAMPPDALKGDAALSQQVSELQAKIAQLEAELAKNAPPSSVAAPAAPDAGAMPGMAAPATPKANRKSAKPGAKTAANGMAAMPASSGAATNKMAMMEKMMGMMDKMMTMEDDAMPAAAAMPPGGGMDMDDKSEMGGMGGGGAMPAGAPAAGMSGGGAGMGMMDDDKMEMAAMMGMGAMGSSAAAGAMSQSILPGFPGASHLYHIGATDFFLDHPQHIALTTGQRAALNKAKEQALLDKSTADRAIAQAEQGLWTLTASDQPDAAQIDAKVSEIGSLRCDERKAYIRAVGEAAKLLTDEQRKILTGFAAPAPSMSAPAQPAPAATAEPMPMKDM